MRSTTWLVFLSILSLAAACGGGGGEGGGLPCGPGVTCPGGQECVDNVCVAPGGGADTVSGDVCAPVCGERQCGDNGCGGACGTCGAGETCNASGLCVPAGCVVDCVDRQCGDDGCGGSCGACPDGTSCNVAGRCVTGPCQPDCGGRECGDDGCGGSCGGCATGESCTEAGRCEEGPCEPQCAGRDCGPDGCGGNCGPCPTGETCAGTACVPGECGDGAPAIEGTLQTDVTDVGFDAVRIEMTHKQDIDPYEDGCITSIDLEFTNGVGCRLFLQASGAWDVEGGLRITRLSFGADSQCVNFPDEREGDFEIAETGRIGSIVPAQREVPDENAVESCFTTTLRVRLDPRTVQGVDVDGAERQLEIEGATLRVTGEVVSTGDTRGRCPCEPSCAGRECGGDGCGDDCGTCSGNEQCTNEGVCVCVPDCGGKDCGGDGCGGSCGTCDGDLSCVDDRCVCVPDCGDRECGDDGCGGSCGDCGRNGTCTAAGQCLCEPECGGRQCGDDGCGGSCGECAWGYTCEANGRCGCGDIGSLGCCEGTLSLWCQSDPFSGTETIQLRDCGAEGQNCGWVSDQTGYYCGATGHDPNGLPRDCGLPSCERQCAGRECGRDGCGGSCGSCDPDESCDDGQCVPCQPQCAGRECGADGCGGSCGTCGAGEDCATSTGQCLSQPPVEEFGKSCASEEDCFEGMVCMGLFPGLETCTMECVPIVEPCPHGLTCVPDIFGTGEPSYCMSIPM